MYEIVLVVSTWLIGACICGTVIYWITSSAIESSKLAREVQELKQMLQQLLNDQQNPANQSEQFVEYCPACSSRLSPTDLECPTCTQYEQKKGRDGVIK